MTQHTALLLREVTRDAHDALESTALARALMSPALTLVTYRDVLQAWSTAWVGVESALRASVGRAHCEDMIPLERSALAKLDLQTLERMLPTAERYVHFQPMVLSPMQPAQTEEELLGMAYVVVGSSLGGKVIARHLQSVLRMGAGVGMAFFGDEVRGVPAWPEWLRAFNARVVGAHAQQQALVGALRTFDYLRHAFLLSEPSPTPVRRVA